MTAIFRSNSIFDSTPPLGEGSETRQEKIQRCKLELKMAGMTKYGFTKFNSRYLPKIIHDDEHIMGVIYGRYPEGPGVLSWTDRMVVATDRRVISLNHKPGYTDVDEFTYDVIDGVESLRAGFYTAVRINTKIDVLFVRMVNPRCAERFVHYIEKRRIEYYEGTRG